jgi:hypothetical protein
MFLDTVFDSKSILPNGPGFMIETLVPRDPGQDDTPPGVPPGPGDYPELGSPDWQLVPDSPDWLDDEAYQADGEDPGDWEEYEDPGQRAAGRAG